MILKTINESGLISIAANPRFPVQEINFKTVFSSEERKIVSQKTFTKIERNAHENPTPKIKGTNKRTKKFTKGAIKEIILKLDIIIGSVNI
jgi:hypothetical protein